MRNVFTKFAAATMLLGVMSAVGARECHASVVYAASSRESAPYLNLDLVWTSTVPMVNVWQATIDGKVVGANLPASGNLKGIGGIDPTLAHTAVLYSSGVYHFTIPAVGPAHINPNGAVYAGQMGPAQYVTLYGVFGNNASFINSCGLQTSPSFGSYGQYNLAFPSHRWPTGGAVCGFELVGTSTWVNVFIPSGN